ncbi:FMRFamide receptor isoform X3 [Folsomia candida]|uniref:FMRFamide receptor isoform X3 n=1 Tax=Folsomia candida TaxID=158441 RepID=UPI0016052262|nr:FMRFamide receptor isoform X3 [Folsomia candida]
MMDSNEMGYHFGSEGHPNLDNFTLGGPDIINLTGVSLGDADFVEDGAISWEESFRDLSRFWVQRVLVPIVVIVGVLGNLVTIYILTRRPMRSSTNVYLCALAVSDLMFLLFSFSMSWRFYPGVETIWMYFWYLPFGFWLTDAASSTSVWLTVSFTIERYIAVCFPLRGKWWIFDLKVLCTEERAVKVAIGVYLICFAVTSPTPFEWTAATVANSTNSFNETIYRLEPTEFGKNEMYRLIYHWFSSIFFIFLPVVILAIFNFFLIQAVRHSRDLRKTMTDQHQNSSVRHIQAIRQENRITIILISVVIVFLVCQSPTAIVLIYTSIKLVDYSSSEGFLLLGLGNIFNLLVAINASINFLLYTALSDKYRKYFLAFFPCLRKSRMGRQTNHVNNFDGNPYEMDTMNTTLSLSRGASLYSSARNSPYLGRDGGSHVNNAALRRAATSPRSPMSNNRLDVSPGGRKNIHITMQDGKVPLIQVDQV